MIPPFKRFLLTLYQMNTWIISTCLENVPTGIPGHSVKLLLEVLWLDQQSASLEYRQWTDRARVLAGDFTLTGCPFVQQTSRGTCRTSGTSILLEVSRSRVEARCDKRIHEQKWKIYTQARTPPAQNYSVDIWYGQRSKVIITVT